MLPSLARTRAFTLIELLAVIGVVAILAAILFPALSSAKSASHGSVCLSNLRQIGTATHLYLADYDDRLPYVDAVERPHIGFVARLAPYGASGRVWLCPEDRWPQALSDSTERGTTYFANAGSSYDCNVDLADAPATATSVVEPAGIVWMRDDGPFHPRYDELEAGGTSFYQAEFVDGHAKRLSRADLAALRAQGKA